MPVCDISLKLPFYFQREQTSVSTTMDPEPEIDFTTTYQSTTISTFEDTTTILDNNVDNFDNLTNETIAMVGKNSDKFMEVKLKALNLIRNWPENTIERDVRNTTSKTKKSDKGT